MTFRMKFLLIVSMSLIAGHLSAAELLVFPTAASDFGYTKVSDNGETVTGWNRVNSSWRWTRASGIIPLGLLPGSLAAAGEVGFGMSSDGNIIYIREVGLWSESQDLQPIRLGQGRTFGQALSGDGSVVYGLDGLNNAALTRWKDGEGYAALGALPGETELARGSAIDVSVDGALLANTISSGPYIWRPDTGFEKVGTLFPYGISGDGMTVVGVEPDLAVLQDRAALWTRERGVELLPPLSPESWHRASAVSFDGSIVVGDGNGSYLGAFIWDRVRGTRSLEAVAAARGIDMQGRQFQTVDDMSADGRFIVGTMAGLPMAYLLDLGAPVPEPAGMVVAAVALAAVHGTTRGRRRWMAAWIDPGAGDDCHG